MTYALPRLAIALSAALWALPVQAQSFADLQQGPIGACLSDHFDAPRYQAELAEAGWAPADEGARAALVEILSLAFLPVSHPAPAGQPDDPEARREAARAVWRAELAEREALVQGDSVLFLRGHVQSDRFRRVDCWLVTPDAAFVNGLIAQGTEPVAEGAEAAVQLGPFRVSDQAEAVVRASRYPNPPGPVWGLVTQMLILPAAP
jgi:hypothetical protein